MFAGALSTTLMADEIEIAGFDAFLARYKNAFDVERTAVRTLK